MQNFCQGSATSNLQHPDAFISSPFLSTMIGLVTVVFFVVELAYTILFLFVFCADTDIAEEIDLRGSDLWLDFNDLLSQQLTRHPAPSDLITNATVCGMLVGFLAFE